VVIGDLGLELVTALALQIKGVNIGKGDHVKETIERIERR
jgi:hypothetical protein